MFTSSWEIPPPKKNAFSPKENRAPIQDMVLEPTRGHAPNTTSIGSVVFVGVTAMTNRLTTLTTKHW